jgi:hypothetical protein
MPFPCFLISSFGCRGEWRETGPCCRPPAGRVEGLKEPSTRGFCRKSFIAARSRHTPGAFRDENKEDPLTAEEGRGDVKRQPAGPRSNVDRQKIRRLDSRLFNQEFARTEGAERYLRRGSVTGTQNLTDHGHRAAVVPVPVLARGRGQSIAKWLHTDG